MSIRAAPIEMLKDEALLVIAISSIVDHRANYIDLHAVPARKRTLTCRFRVICTLQATGPEAITLRKDFV
jgi:hypothetical protein